MGSIFHHRHQRAESRFARIRPVNRSWINFADGCGRNVAENLAALLGNGSGNNHFDIGGHDEGRWKALARFGAPALIVEQLTGLTDMDLVYRIGKAFEAGIGREISACNLRLPLCSPEIYVLAKMHSTMVSSPD